MYWYGMLLYPQGNGTHALKHKMYQKRETQGKGEVGNKVEGEGSKKKKRFTEQEM